MTAKMNTTKSLALSHRFCLYTIENIYNVFKFKLKYLHLSSV